MVFCMEVKAFWQKVISSVEWMCAEWMCAEWMCAEWMCAEWMCAEWMCAEWMCEEWMCEEIKKSCVLSLAFHFISKINRTHLEYLRDRDKGEVCLGKVA